MSSEYRVRDALRETFSLMTYPALGYEMQRRTLHAGELDVDLHGRVCVVTGASSGLGLAAAAGLSARGATVVMVSRNPERGKAALRSIESASRDAKLELELVDLSNMKEVRDLCQRIKARHSRVDVLLNNAGVVLWTRKLSEEGIEATLATNLLSGFLLTHELLPALRRAAPSRIIHVTSALMYGAKLSLDTLTSLTEGPYDGMRAYVQTKRAQVVLNELWAERLASMDICSNCVHPGTAATPGAEQAFPRSMRWLGPLLRTPDQGADTMLWLAVSDAAKNESGKLWFDRKARPSHLVPWTRSTREEAEKLWTLCARRSGVVV